MFRSADAFEAEAASREMTSHGYTDRFVLVAVATRTQFPAGPPLGWRRAKGTRTVPAPAIECLIASMGVDDPLFYTFVLLCRQVPAPGV